MNLLDGTGWVSIELDPLHQTWNESLGVLRPRCMYIVVCQCFKMADANEKLLAELLKKPGNNVCADCGAKSECVS